MRIAWAFLFAIMTMVAGNVAAAPATTDLSRAGAIAGFPNSATTAPNEVVVSRLPYRAAQRNNACPATCNVPFPAVAAKHRLEISNISCLSVVESNEDAYGSYSVNNKGGALLYVGFFPLTLQSQKVINVRTANQNVFIPINAGEHLVMTAYGTGAETSLQCGVSGQMVTLQ